MQERIREAQEILTIGGVGRVRVIKGLAERAVCFQASSTYDFHTDY